MSLQLNRTTDFALFHCDQIAIDVLWGENRRAPSIVKLQGFEMSNLNKTLERLDYLLTHMRCVRTLSINLEISSTKEVDAILEKFLDAENVRLEVLKVRRRYVGQRFDLLSDLIKVNAETLRVVKRIGLSEAVDGFNEKVRLDRLSLMNFDLVDDGELESPLLEERTRDCIRRLGRLGATFSHLSYTTFTGFDMSRNPTLFMLRQCAVSSLRLTMQKGSPITDLTLGAVKPLLMGLERLELVGLMSAPREHLSALFPNLEFYNVEREEFEQDNHNQCTERIQTSPIKTKPSETYLNHGLMMFDSNSLAESTVSLNQAVEVCCN